jgi:hypothetical protein
MRGHCFAESARPVAILLSTFKFAALAALCPAAKDSRRLCCAVCNSNQRNTSVCINFFFCYFADFKTHLTANRIPDPIAMAFRSRNSPRSNDSPAMTAG